MARVVGIDHLVIRVSDYQTSKAFYGKLFAFLGFKVLEEYADAIGWTNGKARFWIGPADAQGRKRQYRSGDIGFHHYAFELRSPEGCRRAPGVSRRAGRCHRRSRG